MNVHICVEPDQEKSNYRIRVAGLLDDDGARLLNRTCREVLKKKDTVHLEVDLEEVSFISEKSTRILCRLKNKPQIDLIGPHFLTLAMIKAIEAR